MYLEFHQLKLAPFENTPDPRFFFPSEDHREALANLVYAVRSHKGMVLITGDVGMGKTTTAYFLETRIRDTARIAVIREAPPTPKQLLWHVADQLGLAPDAMDNRGQLFKAIEDELRRQHEMKRTVLLIIDEAQALPHRVLDEVRFLSNIENATQKLCQIMLLGQSELRQILRDPKLEALRQRIVLAHHISPLSRDNTERYLRHRVNTASITTPSIVRFTDGAVGRIHELTGGIIRQINVIADKALLVSRVRRTHEINGSVIEDAVREMVGPTDPGATVWAEAVRRKAA